MSSLASYNAGNAPSGKMPGGRSSIVWENNIATASKRTVPLAGGVNAVEADNGEDPAGLAQRIDDAQGWLGNSDAVKAASDREISDMFRLIWAIGQTVPPALWVELDRRGIEF